MLTILNYSAACTSSSPGVDCAGGWSYTSKEHYCAGFAEAIGTFLGDVAYYWPAAVQPTSCNSIGTCSAVGDNMETSNGTSCSSLRRRPKEAMRYLRDAYDTHNDSTYNDNVSHVYADFVDALAAMPTGTGNGQRNEPWNTANPPAIDNADGRNALDFSGLLPNSTSTQFAQNCSPGN